MTVQLDIFKDAGIQPGLIRVWFDARVETCSSEHHDHKWGYHLNIRYRPVPSSHSLGSSGFCLSYNDGVNKLFSICEEVLDIVRRSKTEKEIMDCYREQASLGHIIHRKDRPVNYSLTVNGTEIIKCTRWKGWKEEDIERFPEDTE